MQIATLAQQASCWIPPTLGPTYSRIDPGPSKSCCRQPPSKKPLAVDNPLDIPSAEDCPVECTKCGSSPEEDLSVFKQAHAATPRLARAPGLSQGWSWIQPALPGAELRRIGQNGAFSAGAPCPRLFSNRQAAKRTSLSRSKGRQGMGLAPSGAVGYEVRNGVM